MTTQPRCLEIDGGRDYGPEVFRGVCRDHLFAHVADDGDISIQADVYHPEDEQKWDVDEWEGKSCYLSGKATRDNWTALYRIGRALARRGKVMLRFSGQDPVELVCDGSLFVLSP